MRVQSIQEENKMEQIEAVLNEHSLKRIQADHESRSQPCNLTLQEMIDQTHRVLKMGASDKTIPLYETLPRPPWKYQTTPEESTKQYEYLKAAHREAMRTIKPPTLVGQAKECTAPEEESYGGAVEDRNQELPVTSNPHEMPTGFDAKKNLITTKRSTHQEVIDWFHSLGPA